MFDSEEKLQMCRAMDPSEPLTSMPNFSQGEMTRLWNRMRQARRQAPDEAQREWQRAEGAPVREGKTDLKRKMLWEWIKDPQWSRMQVTECNKRVQQQTRTDESRWITKGRLEMLVGQTECRQMLEGQELMTKPHPHRHGQYLYYYSEEACLDSTSRSTTVLASGSKDVESGEFGDLKAALTTTETKDSQPQPKKAKKIDDKVDMQTICDKDKDKPQPKAQKSDEQKKFDLVKKVVKDIRLVSLELGRSTKKLEGDSLEEARCTRMRDLQQQMMLHSTAIGSSQDDVGDLVEQAKSMISEAKKLIKCANTRV